MTKNKQNIPSPPEPERKDVHRMFDRISGRYDLLNRLLSMRRDVAWRKKMTTLAGNMSEGEMLDIATGTGDVLLTFADKLPTLQSGTGLDMSEKMLELAQEKFSRHRLANQLTTVRADAENLPFETASFDLVTIAFGIRNVVDVSNALVEMNRVLKPNGKVLILEFSLPQQTVMRWLYLFYFRKILPAIGAIVSGDGYAYRYLNQTVETFPYGESFCTLMRTAGFTEVKDHRLTFGIASIYEGAKLI